MPRLASVCPPLARSPALAHRTHAKLAPQAKEQREREAREAFEREYLLTQINRFGGNISRTANFVGMERSALHRKLKSLGVVTSGKAGGRLPQMDDEIETADADEA